MSNNRDTSTPSAAIASATPHSAYVALGANLGEPLAQVRAAIDALAHLPHTHVCAASSLYRTAPQGVRGQNDFINAVAALKTDLSANALLSALHDLEETFGRQRPYPMAARTLDLDLLLYDTEQIASPCLQIPHPRMHQRAFVLVPLLEIAPDCVIPGLGRASNWLVAVRDQALCRISPSVKGEHL